MNLKLFLFGMTLVYFITVKNVDTQFNKPPDSKPGVGDSDDINNYYNVDELKDLYESEPQDNPSMYVECDEPICFPETCKGYGKPPECPKNVKECRSGCAQIAYCNHPHLSGGSYYYETKYCRTPHRIMFGVFESSLSTVHQPTSGTTPKRRRSRRRPLPTGERPIRPRHTGTTTDSEAASPPRSTFS